MSDNGDSDPREDNDNQEDQNGSQGNAEENPDNLEENGDNENPEEKKDGEDDLDENGEPKPDPNAERKEFHAKLKENLSQLSKIHNNWSYAYVNLNLAEKEVKSLFGLIEQYPHLRYINLAQNEIEDIENIVHATYLLALDVSQNQISKVDLFTNPNNLMFL